MAIPKPTVILASQSPYRRQLLGQILADFEVQPANADESRAPGESPAELATRLAQAKAAVVADKHPDAVVIGSDQVAALGDRVLGKPGNYANAASQLADSSGRAVVFYTAVSVVQRNRGFAESHTDITKVQLRNLTKSEIDDYLKLDEPWDCAGSFKSEANGSQLFEKIEAEDATGLIGLPLIWVGNCLSRAGVTLLDTGNNAQD